MANGGGRDSEDHARDESEESAGPRGQGWPMALAALGVVYGDIGTSPLYALRECFSGSHGIAVTEESVLGVLSLVVWALILIISVKYIVFVLRADNRGEGGILALTALALPKQITKAPFALLGLGIFGAALLYGDGIITPAISVLSAVEGLTLATPIFKPFVIPLAVLILLGLFWMQKHGTATIGRVFGPIMVVWFLTISLLGLGGILENPGVLKALNPLYAIDFFGHHRVEGYFALGALFLVVTGGESLYVDLGHFGRLPIRRAWFTMVLPGLLLNYFGQGALLLKDPSAAINPFFLLAPSWLLYPLIGLATIAAVIASQALIAGVFSLTSQAIQLGLLPRLQIIYTSTREKGQIYLPQVNWALFLGTIGLVLMFESSTHLAAVYGISVSATMVITSVLLFVVARTVWKWSLVSAISILSVFLLIDLMFFSANLAKVAQGGWVPILISGALFTAMATWRKGRMILAERLRGATIKMTDFLKLVSAAPLARVPGVAVFMVGDKTTTPPALVHNVKHNKVLHETVIIMTVITKEIPVVSPSNRLRIQEIDQGIYRVIASYGFSDLPDMREVIGLLRQSGMSIELENITFFLGRETLIASENPGMARWREHLFSFMSKNAQRATAYFNIPVDQVIEVGIQVEL